MQKEVAIDSKSSEWTISRLESGTRIPRLEKLEEIATALEVEIVEFFDFSWYEGGERGRLMRSISYLLRRLRLGDLRSTYSILQEISKIRSRRRWERL